MDPQILDNQLFGLAILIACGLAAGELARRFHLPSVTGQILVGVVLGPSVLGLFDAQDAHALQPVINFALGLIAVAVGSHLHLFRLGRFASRLGWLLLAESTLTPLLVYGAVRFVGGGNLAFGLLLGTLAVSTAPATIVALVKETRSRGVFVNTLLTAVALNNIACIALFELAFAAVRASVEAGDAGTGAILLAPLVQLLSAAALGLGLGGLLVILTRHVAQPEKLTTISLISIFLAVGAAEILGISSLLACLFLGASIANLAPAKEEIGHRVFANFEPAILATFFTVAGTELQLGRVGEAGLLATAVIVARIAGKWGAGWLAMRVADVPQSLRRYLGLALIPQAGVAVGLLLKVRESDLFDHVGQLFLVVGVGVVAINEIIGPLTTRLALVRSGEAGKDRPRLIDFLHEENIVTGFHADSKEEAIRKLVDLLLRSHMLTGIDREDMVQEVLDRERLMSTCIGRGLFVPHAEHAGVSRIVGVMAISEEGLPLATPDELPVHCIALLVIPPDERERHVAVMAALARAIGMDPAVQTQLYRAKSPAHVFEILHAEEFEDYNYFLD